MRDSRETAARAHLRILLLLTPSVFVLICAVLPAARRRAHLESDSLSFLQMQYEARSLVEKKLHPGSHEARFHSAPQP